MTSAQFRKAVKEKYNFDGPAAEVLVEEVATTLDEVELLKEAIRSKGALIEGARGNLVANPAFVALKHQRLLLSRLLGELFPKKSPQEVARDARRKR